MTNTKTNVKTKLLKFLKTWGILIAIDLFLILIVVSLMIESAFWKEVPYNARHLTDDLPTYLIYFRTIIITIMSVCLIAINLMFILSPSSPSKDSQEQKAPEDKNNNNNDTNINNNKD